MRVERPAESVLELIQGLVGIWAMGTRWQGDTGRNRMTVRFSGALRRAATVALILLAANVADAANDPLRQFIRDYRCMIVEHLKTIHERGQRSKSDNRYLILAMNHHPQRFVQCIFEEIDTKLYCEASSGRYSTSRSLTLSQAAVSDLEKLGFKPPHEIANFSKELALGSPPDFTESADMMLEVMFRIYSARDGSSMALDAPLVTHGRTFLSKCKPLS